MQTHVLRVVAASALLVSAPALAHHEAIFGPQSSLVLSSPAFLSVQAFSRRMGAGRAVTQESTALVSAGVSPIESVPLSFTVIAPFSHIDEAGVGQTGPEDVILGTRYRFDLKGLQQTFDREGNFLLGMAAVELPTGNIDHPAFNGPLDGMWALMGSVEWSRFSLIGYGFHRLHGVDADGVRAGDLLYLGAGLAYTPVDDHHSGQILSFQLGLSNEFTFSDRRGNEVLGDTGGFAFVVHPTVVWSPGNDMLVFGMVSLPAYQRYANASDEERWRVGAGVLWML